MYKGGAYTKLLRGVKNVTGHKRITNEVLYAGLPRISTTIRVRRLRFSSHCWRSKNEVDCDLVFWERKHGKRCVGGQAHTFVNLMEVDTGVHRDCLLPAMDRSNGVGWRESRSRGEGRSTEVNLVVVVGIVVVVVVV